MGSIPSPCEAGRGWPERSEGRVRGIVNALCDAFSSNKIDSSTPLRLLNSSEFEKHKTQSCSYACPSPASRLRRSAPSPAGGEGKEPAARAPRPSLATTRARALRSQMTDAERKLWFALRDRRFANFKFRRQVPLGPFIGDFVCFSARLVVEVDGSQHADSPRDERREEPPLVLVGTRARERGRDHVRGHERAGRRIRTERVRDQRCAANLGSEPRGDPAIQPGSAAA